MAGRVVLPLFALNQLPVNVYGRAIAPGLTPHHMYLPGPRRGLFNWNAARRAEEIVLVESVIDALSLVEAGVGQVIGLFGAHGVTEEHRELVRRFGVKRVVVALDCDQAGHEAAPQVAGSDSAVATAALAALSNGDGAVKERKPGSGVGRGVRTAGASPCIESGVAVAGGGTASRPRPA